MGRELGALLQPPCLCLRPRKALLPSVVKVRPLESLAAEYPVCMVRGYTELHVAREHTQHIEGGTKDLFGWTVCRIATGSAPSRGLAVSPRKAVMFITSCPSALLYFPMLPCPRTSDDARCALPAVLCLLSRCR
jgi:hypothetical protein